MRTKKLITRYPWDEWLKQDKFTVNKGVDFDCAMASMSVQIRQAAGKRKIKVTVLSDEDTGTIDVYVRQRGKKKTKYGKEGV
jgi:hypothetical protein